MVYLFAEAAVDTAKEITKEITKVTTTDIFLKAASAALGTFVVTVVAKDLYEGGKAAFWRGFESTNSPEPQAKPAAAGGSA